MVKPLFRIGMSIGVSLAILALLLKMWRTFYQPIGTRLSLSFVNRVNRRTKRTFNAPDGVSDLSIALDFVALFSIAIFIVAKQMFAGGVTGWAVSALILAAMLSIVALVGLFLITPWFVKTLIKTRPGWLVEGTWRSKLMGFLQDINLSLQSVWSSGKAGHVVTVSILIRILKYFGFYLLFQAVASGSFVELSELPVEHIISALIGGEVGSSLPIPAFMSFGVYEAGSALVFQLLGVGDQAATFITMLCVHIWSQAFEYLVGGVFIVIFLLLNRKTSNYATVGSAQTNRKRSILSGGVNYARAVMIIIAGSVLMAGGLFLTYQLWSASKLGAFSAPSAGGVASNIDDWLTHISSRSENLQTR